MMHRRRALRDNYLPALMISISLLLASIVNGQVYQEPNNNGSIFKVVGAKTGLRLPDDSTRGHLAGDSLKYWLAPKGNALLMFVPDSGKFINITASTNPLWGGITGSISAQADLMALLNAKVPKTTTLTINGIAHDLSTNQSWGPFLVPADTVWIHNKLVSISVVADSSNYVNGLYKAGNQIGAHYELPIWNANRIQGYYVDATRPGNGYFLGFDSTIGVARWMRPDSVVGGGGSTPDLQAVTGVGGTTTNVINANGGIIASNQNIASVNSLTGRQAGLFNGDLTVQNVANYQGTIRPDLLTASRDYFLPETGNAQDTIATFSDLRALSGGGSTPGIDDVLGVNQSMTTNRSITLNGNTLSIQASGHPDMTFKPNGFVNMYYYGFPTGAFHMNTGTFNGVAAFWNTAGDFIEKAAGATNIISKTNANDGDEVYPFQGTIKVDASGGNTTLILGDPDDGGFNKGAMMTFIKTDASANTVTVDAFTNWGATVNGVHTKTLTTQWQYITVQSDGTNWYVVANN